MDILSLAVRRFLRSLGKGKWKGQSSFQEAGIYGQLLRALIEHPLFILLY